MTRENGAEISGVCQGEGIRSESYLPHGGRTLPPKISPLRGIETRSARGRDVRSGPRLLRRP